jgi:uncharacterized protein YjdB
VLSSFFTLDVHASELTSVNVGYQIKGLDNWTDYSFGGVLSGSEGLDEAQGLSIHLVNAPYEAAIEYRVYTQSGWKDWVKDFSVADGNGMDILGVQIKLVNYANADVHYQVYRKGLGWGTWVKNGSTAGNLNASNPITGIRIKVFELGVKYQSSISNNWLIVRHNAEDQGTGVLETVRIDFENPIINARIVYRAYFSNSGWTNWAKNWETLGQSGSSNQLEALEVKLENLPGYSVAVQPYVKGVGWSEWVYDGEMAGNIGLALEAYRIKILKVKVVIPEVSSEPVIVEGPNTSNLTLDAAEHEDWYGLAFEGKTIDGIFTEPFGFAYLEEEWVNYQIQLGWKIKGLRAVAFAGEGDTIRVPKTFTRWGDDSVYNEQFQVYLGTYINGVFTVTGNNSNSFNLTGATHTMILYDNEDPDDYDGYVEYPGYLDGIVVTGVYRESYWLVNTSDPTYNYLYLLIRNKN